MPQKDFYKILGVNRSANEADIKKAFRRAARQYHPDQAKGDKKEAEEKFKEVAAAYEVLGDKQKRAQYDQFGSAGTDSGGGASGTGGFGQNFGGFDFSGGGAHFGGGFSDIFESFFGGGGTSRSRGSAAGANLEARLKVKFIDAVFGTTAEFQLTRMQKCAHCHGNAAEPGSKIKTCSTCGGAGEVMTTQQTVFGQMQHRAVCPDCNGEGKTYERKCTACHGTGRARKSEKIKVRIPAGVDDGAVIRLAGQGEAGPRGGKSGDLFIRVLVEPSQEFRREGADIHSTQEIHFLRAVLGDEVEVRTVHGLIKLKIPAGTQSHQIFKLRGYGAPQLNSTARGDHFVKIIVETPKKISRTARKLFEELAKESNLKIKKGGLFGH